MYQTKDAACKLTDPKCGLEMWGDVRHLLFLALNRVKDENPQIDVMPFVH